jgi:hypothetical protein
VRLFPPALSSFRDVGLKEVVHVYNTRDVYPYPVLSGNCPKGTVEKVTCWPMPEDPNNENTTIGKLGLVLGKRAFQLHHTSKLRCPLSEPRHSRRQIAARVIDAGRSLEMGNPGPTKVDRCNHSRDNLIKETRGNLEKQASFRQARS